MKIKIIVFILAVILIILAVIISFNKNEEESLKVNAVPIANKTIVLDARTPVFLSIGNTYCIKNMVTINLL